MSVTTYSPHIILDMTKNMSRIDKALWEAAAYSNVKTVKKMLKRGANIDAPDKHGITSIARASQHGYEGIVRELAKQGGNVNFRCRDGYTPVYWACDGQFMDVVKTLVEFGADLELIALENVGPPLYWASGKAKEFLVPIRGLCECGANVNYRHKKGISALSRAACDGRLQVAKILVEFKADLNLADDNGRTPMYMAVKQGHLSMISFLAESGADMNVYVTGGTARGMTAIHAAAHSGNIATISLLYKLGANFVPRLPIIGDISTGSISNVARKNGHEEAATYIEDIVSKLKAKKCAHCEHPATRYKELRRCSKCMVTLYCNKECQRNDSVNHGRMCRKPVPLTENQLLHQSMMSRNSSSSSSMRSSMYSDLFHH
jgi:ankyrin repeat protein